MATIETMALHAEATLPQDVWRELAARPLTRFRLGKVIAEHGWQEDVAEREALLGLLRRGGLDDFDPRAHLSELVDIAMDEGLLLTAPRSATARAGQPGTCASRRGPASLARLRARSTRP